ncbi:phosphotransferase enzyme family protein [Microlunatus soli]|uniref:Ser/Thr protein kinase RdoA involved in Cpx stress response, MazF antagonist n=1 Tax=Microlunatus soli TaxID=630515 RepID=A0A1H2ADW6_9ACTN|nr:aminoglycoside phosphotransferase family protein [Microlunatus soli]SDT43952.1 Ser/Thr protein kinase RdoA involved in Cpx stress response, MazF antagonist [Microlunatus soli]
MQDAQVSRAIAAATSVVESHGLRADDAVVLHNSNKLTVRVTPAEVVARIIPPGQGDGRFEIDLAQQLAAADCPVAVPDRRIEPIVHHRDGFMITFWTHYRPVTTAEPPPTEYAAALARLHAGMRTVDFPTPHFTDRVAEAQQLVTNRADTPELGDADREMLDETLRRLRQTVTSAAAPDQLLHGEPHPGNLVSTADGPVFVDLETSCRGPVEFDLAHAPDGVGEVYPGADPELLQQCRLLMLAMITMWRWDRNDEFPDGRRIGIEWTNQIRAAIDRAG